MKSMLNTYGTKGLVKLVFYKLNTIIFFSKSRLIRFPLIIRGKKYIDFGSGLTTGVGCRFEAYYNLKSKKTLKIGKNVQINDYVHITAMSSVIIGDNVLMASKIYISDCTHGFYGGSENDSSPNEIPTSRSYEVKHVVIENNVWLGEFVSVLPGVTIGEGSIIGANSVVNKSIPPNCIAVGSPARIVKRYNFETKKWQRTNNTGKFI